MSYVDTIKKVLPRDMRRLFVRLNSPTKLQDYLDRLPVNFELSGETSYSPIEVFKKRAAHCFEGAVFAAAVLAFHGHKPLLMDFATAYDDEDHTIALYKKARRWGALSKTNHAVLKFRDPLYLSTRELAMSFFHEYYLWDGRKSLRAYSAPFDLSIYPPDAWITTRDSLDWLMEALSATRYFPIVPKHFERQLRRASKVELQALKVFDFPDPRKIIRKNS